MALIGLELAKELAPTLSTTALGRVVEIEPGSKPDEPEHEILLRAYATLSYRFADLWLKARDQ